MRMMKDYLYFFLVFLWFGVMRRTNSSFSIGEQVEEGFGGQGLSHKSRQEFCKVYRTSQIIEFPLVIYEITKQRSDN